MTAPFERKYQNEQWLAIYDAHFARGLKYPRIAELARTGELTGEPFEISTEYLAERVRGEKRRREGKNVTPLAAIEPKDATEEMRVRLISLWDSERVVLEREKDGKRDLARLTMLAKLAVEIARIPGPKEPRPSRSTGTRDADGNRPSRLAGGHSGALIKALRGSDNGGTRDGQSTPDPAGQVEAPETAEGPRDGGPSGARLNGAAG